MLSLVVMSQTRPHLWARAKLNDRPYERRADALTLFKRVKGDDFALPVFHRVRDKSDGLFRLNRNESPQPVGTMNAAAGDDLRCAPALLQERVDPVAIPVRHSPYLESFGVHVHRSPGVAFAAGRA